MDSDEYSIHIHTYVAVYSIKVYSVCVDILKYIIERDKNRAFVSSNQFKSKIKLMSLCTTILVRILSLKVAYKK